MMRYGPPWNEEDGHNWNRMQQKFVSEAICQEQKTTYPPTLIARISPVVFVLFAIDDGRLDSSSVSARNHVRVHAGRSRTLS